MKEFERKEVFVLKKQYITGKSGLDTKIEWKYVKIWKPNLIQKLLIKLRIIKDPRYNGKKINNYLLDEAVMWQDPNRFL